MTSLNIQRLKRQQYQLEQDGILLDCWIAQYTPRGTAKKQYSYYQLRSRHPLPHGKYTLHLRTTEEISHYTRLIENGRQWRKLEKLLTRTPRKRLSRREVITSTTHDEWYTPPEFVDLARKVMGSIDCDPASNEVAQSWILAGCYYTAATNGLAQPWCGRVWLNPPYGTNLAHWTNKLIAEYKAGNVIEAILLVRPAAGSKWHNTLAAAFPRCEPVKRIRFLNTTGIPQASPVHGNVFFYLGMNIEQFHAVFSTVGTVSIPFVPSDSAASIDSIRM